jgi:putative ABC transport system permease protein
LNRIAVEKLIQDIQYGLRTLRKSPGFTVTAVLSLALAIGASTAVFSIVNSTLLRPLPYKEPERLVAIWETVRRQEVERRGASYPDYQDWRAQSQSFENIAVIKVASFNLSGIGEPERITGEYVTASYFPVLGVDAARGRTFLPEEDNLNHPQRVAVISHSLWQRRFGSSPSLVNQTIKLNDEDYAVAGIMPDSFQGTRQGAEVWVLLTNTLDDPAHETLSGHGLQLRGVRGLATIARLKPNVTVAQAQQEMDGISLRLEQAYPQTNTNRGVVILSLYDDWLGDTRDTLILFMVAVGCVLLIACGNVANLQLVRASNRQKEMAIRVALGASRLRLTTQMLTESLLLALLGGALGLLLALWGIDLVVALSPFTIPWFVSVGLDARVFAFTFAISILTGVLFGLLPALQASRLDLNQSLKEGRATWWRRPGSIFRLRGRGLLVVLEIALAVVLLIGAGLMTKSFQRLYSIDLGFNPDRLLTMKVELPSRRYDESQTVIFTNTLTERLNQLPHLLNGSLSSDIPLGNDMSATTFAVEGLPAPPPGNALRTYIHHVGPKYFETLGARLVRGREFQAEDNAEAQRVVIISRALSERFWPGQDPLGKQMKEGSDPESERPWYKIIGVAPDIHHRNMKEGPNDDPDIYFCLLQRPVYDLGLLVRTDGEAEAMTAAIRRVVQSIDPELPVYSMSMMQQHLARRTARFRTGAWLMSVFALMALLLAMIGISGMMGYVVTLRTHEIGIRMAVGASERDILKMVLGESMLLIGAGIVLGILTAFAGTRLLSDFLYGVSATDGGVFAGITLLLAGLSLLASYFPARRAMKMNPMTALRQE